VLGSRNDVVNCADVRVIQRRNRSGFMLKTGSQVRVGAHAGGGDLDRDGSKQTVIARSVDFAHATRARKCEDFVGTEPGTRFERHGWLVAQAVPADRHGLDVRH
jgi:hypothetical protein